MTIRHRLRWLALVVAGVVVCAAISVLAYLAVPPHAALIVAVREQCAPLPRGPLTSCMEPTMRDLVAWTGRGMLAGVALAALLAALHPWWMRRRSDLVPLDDSSPALRAELDGLASAGRRPTWLLAPYAYTEHGRAFGLPWRPFVRIDVGLGILFRTDRPRFRQVVNRELDRLRDREAGARYLAAGSVLTLLVAAAAASPVAAPRSAIDSCLVGFWTEQARTQPILQNMSVVWISRGPEIWSFTADGRATLFVGDQTVRAVRYDGSGTIRWHASTSSDELTLDAPAADARLSAPGHADQPASPGDYALPSDYTCTPTSMTLPVDLYTTVLRKIGPPS